MSDNSVLRFKQNLYSQNGEDGIIEYIFKKMNIIEGNFIEFGAWDGKHLSNTYKLFLENWSGIYIESDVEKYKVLKKNFEKENRITCINSLVGFDENDNLDILIKKSRHLNKNFDFFSIDVDGLDYFIFKKLNIYLPKVICIEVNAGHSPLYDKEIPINIASNNIGQSIKLMCDIAFQKNYFPLCYTGNLFFIKNEYRDIFKDDLKTIKHIYLDFLKYLPEEDLLYLKNTFIKKQKFNGFIFKNKYLKDFCSDIK